MSAQLTCRTGSLTFFRVGFEHSVSPWWRLLAKPRAVAGSTRAPARTGKGFYQPCPRGSPGRAPGGNSKRPHGQADAGKNGRPASRASPGLWSTSRVQWIPEFLPPDLASGRTYSRQRHGVHRGGRTISALYRRLQVAPGLVRRALPAASRGCVDHGNDVWTSALPVSSGRSGARRHHTLLPRGIG